MGKGFVKRLDFQTNKGREGIGIFLIGSELYNLKFLHDLSYTFKTHFEIYAIILHTIFILFFL